MVIRGNLELWGVTQNLPTHASHIPGQYPMTLRVLTTFWTPEVGQNTSWLEHCRSIVYFEDDNSGASEFRVVKGHVYLRTRVGTCADILMPPRTLFHKHYSEPRLWTSYSISSRSQAVLVHFITIAIMCTRGQVLLVTEEKYPHPGMTLPSPLTTSSNTSIKSGKPGPFGPYNDPILPASDDMKKIVGDLISMAGGVAAVLLQIAQPSVGAGVAAYSSFSIRPIERGRRSMTYIFVQAFGTKKERRYITNATHKSHENIKGTHGGIGFDANDVDLQLWVAVTTYWSLIESYEIAYGRLNRERKERVYKEFSAMGTALLVPQDKWPKDLDAFDVYWNEQIRQLRVTPEAYKTAQSVLYPAKDLFKFKTLHAWLYIILNGPLSRVATTEMLPEEVSSQFCRCSLVLIRSGCRSEMRLVFRVPRGRGRFINLR